MPTPNIDDDYLAHIRQLDDNSYEYHLLYNHLINTSKLASKHATPFGSASWGECIGLWHDLGKYNPYFQRYLRLATGVENGNAISKVDHSTIGALWAKISEDTIRKFPPIAYCIAGHHAGLPNWIGGLDERLHSREKRELADCSLINAPDKVKQIRFSLPLPVFSAKHPERQIHHWIRMLYSSLVDADWLDTESFMNPDLSKQRGKYLSIDELKGEYDKYMDKFTSKKKNNDINLERQYINNTCRAAGLGKPGIYNLTVPTGGGKTLASLGFALEQAVKYRLDRVIVVIPYTSIISQTASIFRDIFGPDQVIEHHSNIIDDSHLELNTASKLAIENWDAPIIVTTNVQFFESLYASKPSRCRKLHNLSNSVIIVDEVQMLPIEYLKPILHSLEALHEVFNSTILLTTATQPIFGGEIGTGEAKFLGITQPIYDIIVDSDTLFRKFARTTIQMPKSSAPLGFDNLAEELKLHNQVLCVVNTRGEAQEIFNRMPSDTIHLSRMMCSAHIMERISIIKEKLRNNEPVRVISTALIEAGVDIDFPVVYRAYAGLDSIIQAAGRCNREGKQEKGIVKVFNSEKEPPQGLMRKGAQALRELLIMYGDTDLLSPSIMRIYFAILY
ncbi:MAG: CRISPR-associated helicase Cas3', partial [Bacteroidales bacterium]